MSGRKIELCGNTLSIIHPQSAFSVTDEKTGKPIEGWTHDRKCWKVGNCGLLAPSGACQEECRLTLTLPELASGTKVHVRFLWSSGFDETFTIGTQPGAP